MFLVQFLCISYYHAFKAYALISEQNRTLKLPLKQVTFTYKHDYAVKFRAHQAKSTGRLHTNYCLCLIILSSKCLNMTL